MNETGPLELLSEYTAVIRAADEWTIDQAIERARQVECEISEQFPKLADDAHALLEGVLYIRRQSGAARANSGRHLARNIEMAREFLKLCNDPTFSEFSDTRLMQRVGAHQRFKLKLTEARAAILAGLHHQLNSAIVKQFAERGIPNNRRVILKLLRHFDLSSNDRRFDT